MTQATLAENFQAVRDNLVVMGQEAVPESMGTYPFVVKEGNTYPKIDFIVQSGSHQRTSNTTQSYTIALRMRIVCGTVAQGYDGQGQDLMQFTILPTVLQYFEQHPGIRTNALQAPPSLDRVNTAINSFSTGIEDKKLVITLNWNIVFRTNFLRC